ncbi:uncharacterized protein OCT59_013930 [Rhizophagus irregularis]|uniref:uncharacterized protein n=1 Tax=Rhizophagus irregularis TaxID=588596 RepID=UPI00333319AB|nr:hypothetical protein OCT59_013930 [Rhizophagus irregularis]
MREIDGFFKLGLKGWNFFRHSYFRFLVSREFSDSFNLEDSLSEIFGSFNLESSERNGIRLGVHIFHLRPTFPSFFVVSFLRCWSECVTSNKLLHINDGYYLIILEGSSGN